ncbi:MAG TPA: hypothetical protein VJV23_12685 [Candidatus Polarisedimenticolia bacterium]|nr:hypothetical protein [Candidatus Polarisedimenticolia bacterium]
MDLYEKTTRSLEPLGGELFLDAFVAVRGAEAARRAAAVSGSESGRKAVRQEQAARPAAKAQAARMGGGPGRPGSLQDEVQAFMTRDAIEGTDDQEIQEFLKERAGFDPTDLDEPT